MCLSHDQKQQSNSKQQHHHKDRQKDTERVREREMRRKPEREEAHERKREGTNGNRFGSLRTPLCFFAAAFHAFCLHTVGSFQNFCADYSSVMTPTASSRSRQQNEARMGAWLVLDAALLSCHARDHHDRLGAPEKPCTSTVLGI